MESRVEGDERRGRGVEATTRETPLRNFARGKTEEKGVKNRGNEK